MSELQSRARYPRSHLSVITAVLLITLAGTAAAQTQTDIQRDAAEQRRAQERTDQLREQQEKVPDVRLSTPAAPAQLLPESESPCFPIHQLELQGDSAGQFGWVIDSLSGPHDADGPLRKCMGTKGIGVLLQRAQQALIAKGFVTTRVLAQPQDLSKGNLVLTVVPGRIRTIRFQAASDSSSSAAPTSIATAVPAKPGDILNLRDIEQALENLKRVPTAEADIQITPADRPDTSDLVIAYQTVKSWRLSFSLDDSGTKSTGRYQASVTASWDNPLGLNDLFYVTVSNDAGGGDPGPRGTHGSTVHYSLPHGYWTLGTTVSQNRYHQTVAGLTQDYIYSGTSENAEVKLSRLVYRDAVRKTSLSLKAWQRKSNNYIDDTEVQVQRRVVGGWELGINHKDAIGDATLEANLAYKRGTGDFDSIPAPEEAFNEGTSKFGLLMLDLNATVPFKVDGRSFKYSAALRVQDNTTPLTPQDRFAIGGRYSVRGFDGESSLVGERGWTLRNDWSTPLGSSGQEVYLGLDAGEVGGPSSNVLPGKTLSGGVVGLRGSFQSSKTTVQYDFFVGAPLYKPAGFKTAESAAGFSLNISL